MIRNYRVRDKGAFIEGVQTTVGTALTGEVPAPLEITGTPTMLDELAARRAPEDRTFSLVSLNVLNDNESIVVAQDAHSGNWVKISPENGEFIIEEVVE